MPTVRKAAKPRKKPQANPVMPTQAQIDEARAQAKAAPIETRAGTVYGVDESRFKTYVVDADCDEGRLAGMRNKLTSRGYIELEDGPYAVAGYPLGGHIFVITHEDALKNRERRAEIDRQRRRK